MPVHASFQTRSALGLSALAVVLAAAVSKAPELVLPLGPDQGAHAYVGEIMLDGQVPYRDVWQSKAPGVDLVYAAVLSLLRHPWAICEVNGLPYRCG